MLKRRQAVQMFMSENICTLVDLFDKAVAEGVTLPTKKYDEHTYHFTMEVPPGIYIAVFAVHF